MTQSLSIEDLERAVAEIESSGPTTPVSSQAPAPAPVTLIDAAKIVGGTDPADVVKVEVSTPAVPVAAPAVSGHLTLKEYISVDQLKDDVGFDLTNLDKAICEQAGLFVHYANQARLARRQWERMKVTVDVLESKLYAHHREALTDGGKKATEATIDAAVKTDARWFAAQQKVIDARAIYDLTNDSREAFAQRKDMLVQVSVDRRVERQGDMRIMGYNDQQATVAGSRESALAVIAAQRAAQAA